MGADDNHFERLTTYFEKSKLVYDLLLRGAKHLGFYPNDSKISEEQAQLMMQDLIAKKLELSDFGGERSYVYSVSNQSR